MTLFVFPFDSYLGRYPYVPTLMIAFCCSFSDSLILSDFSKIVFPVILISLRIGSNFFSFTDEDFGIHVFPDLTIFNLYRACIGSSFVHLDLDDMVR